GHHGAMQGKEGGRACHARRPCKETPSRDQSAARCRGRCRPAIPYRGAQALEIRSHLDRATCAVSRARPEASEACCSKSAPEAATKKKIERGRGARDRGASDQPLRGEALSQSTFQAPQKRNSASCAARLSSRSSRFSESFFCLQYQTSLIRNTISAA